MRLRISGGQVFDPGAGWQGEVRDLWIADGRMVESLERVDRVIDATGQAVLAGGVDLRGQTATYGLNWLRLGGRLPSPRELGRAYATLGYTHVHEPWLTLTTAAYVHRELAALPIVDTSASLVVNLRELDIWLKAGDRQTDIAQTLQFFLERCRALHLRLSELEVRYRQDYYAHRTLTTADALARLAEIAGAHGLTFCVDASPAVLEATWPPEVFILSGLGLALKTDKELEAALRHLERGVKADMGLLAAPDPGAWNRPVRVDIGAYRPLELNPPGNEDAARRALRLALEYEGENLAFAGAGAALAPVASYPELWRWLGETAARPEGWREGLPDREYSLSEWVWATRTLPAHLLGLRDRGHVQPGAQADVALFDLPAGGRGASRGRCRTLIKRGEVVIEDYAWRNGDVAKVTVYRQSGAERTPLVDQVCQYRTLRQENLWVAPEMGGAWQEV